VPRLSNRLTKRRVAAIAAAKVPGFYPDGLGLYLHVSKRGSVSWILMYRIKPRRRKMGFGPLRLVSLDEARAKRDEAHKQLMTGQDPLAFRAVRRKKQAAASTFAAAAEAYLETTKSKRRNLKGLRQWWMTLLGRTPEGERTEHNYCASLHDLPIAAIDTAAVLAVLKPVWLTKPETASRVRARIEAVIDYAVVHGLAGDVRHDHPNPAKWKGRLEHALATKGEVRDVKHHAALAYFDVPAFIRVLKTRDGLAARALELTILTAVRTGDLIGSDREERPPMLRGHVDLGARMWTIPRTKTGVEHRVPLSDAAVALLTEVFATYADDGSGIVFVGDKRGEPMSNGAMLRVRDRMIADGLVAKGAMTTHGFRAAFKSWAGDQTSFERGVIEACLTHTIGDAVEAAYRRSDFFSKRARLMAAWAAFVTGDGESNVVALRA
jgi:integrase